jgi:hypothetical protein
MQGDLLHCLGIWFRRYRRRHEVAFWFKEINKKAFDSYLSETKFEAYDLASIGCLGRYINYKTKTPVIEIHDTLTDWNLVEVIFHEMVHHFQYETGWNDKNDPHGSLFTDDYSKRFGKVRELYENVR